MQLRSTTLSADVDSHAESVSELVGTERGYTDQQLNTWSRHHSLLSRSKALVWPVVYIARYQIMMVDVAQSKLQVGIMSS